MVGKTAAQAVSILWWPLSEENHSKPTYSTGTSTPYKTVSLNRELTQMVPVSRGAVSRSDHTVAEDAGERLHGGGRDPVLHFGPAGAPFDQI